MSEFNEYLLEEILTFKYGKNQKNIIKTHGKYPILGTGGIIGSTDSFLYNKSSILIGRKGTINKPIYIEKPFWTIDTLFYTEINELKANPRYLFYKLTTINFLKYHESTAIPSLKVDTLNRIAINMHKCVAYQQKIAQVLSILDSKIELNNRINTELEVMAKTIYDYWFVQFDFPTSEETALSQNNPHLIGKPYKSSGGKMVWNEPLKKEIPIGWTVGSLLDIADFVNGLPCQKFRPTNKNCLPVIKIKEMTEGLSNKTELVTAHIPTKSIINNGDVLFSWSASLLVKIWTGGKGALNQHIFKVTSNKYPKTFYYAQLQQYLQHFKMLAENRKTTMGHITQEHLQQSKILLPPPELIQNLDNQIKPFIDQKIRYEIENQKLAQLRDWLLPMLMNGQVKVK